MPSPTPEARLMALALEEARKALDENEEPVGALIVDARTQQVVARAHHQTAMLHDPTAHAVMVALSQLHAPTPEEEELERLHGLEPSKRPEGRELAIIATREPCIMCAGAILVSPAVRKVVFGIANHEFGGCGSALNVLRAGEESRGVEILGGVLEGPCADLWRRHHARQSGRRN